MMRISIITTLLMGVLLLAACEQNSAASIPPPPTALAVAAAELPPTSMPTAVTLPTATPLEATQPPPPTLAPVPTSTPEGGLVEARSGIISAENFGTDRNPLTGELVENPANLQRRPIAFKLSNAPAKYTRPQSGLNEADLVFEHTTEGNLTRFTAIFYGNTPPRVGPVRSARLIDLELPAMYDAALAYSGSSKGVAERLRDSDFRPRILYAGNKGYYRIEDDSKPVEHTLYANPELLWEVLDEKEQNPQPTFTTTNVFSKEPPPGGTPASGININFNWEVVDWHYSALEGRYLRWAEGAIHADGNTNEQVSAANVIVISPFHAFDGKICEQLNADDTCAAYSVEIQLWGTGNAAVFRDGQRYDVIWHRDNRTDSLTFTDQNGDPFPLKIGNTWVQLVPTWLDNPVQVTS
jgi:hypothetical protein